VTPSDRRAHWENRYAECGVADRPASAWVIRACRHTEGTVVDLAAGVGANGAALAALGRTVVAVDFVETAVRLARGRHQRVQGIVADAAALPFAPSSLDTIVCTNFLDRTLFPVLANLLRPGGHLVYETYTALQLTIGGRGRRRGPRDRAFLLEPGELPRLVRPLEVIEFREGLVRDERGRRYCASILARKDALA
jgi:SAM-dependent methyltransferase